MKFHTTVLLNNKTYISAASFVENSLKMTKLCCLNQDTP